MDTNFPTTPPEAPSVASQATPSVAPANIPPPFTLPSMTSVHGETSAKISSGFASASPSGNEGSDSKKKWVKIAVIIGIAVILIGALSYFGKNYLFKGEIKDLALLPKELCESDPLAGSFNEDGLICTIPGGAIYVWKDGTWQNQKPEIAKPKAEEEKEKPEEAGVKPGKDVPAGEEDVACSLDDYTSGEWSACNKEGVQSKVAIKKMDIKCNGEQQILQTQKCGAESSATEPKKTPDITSDAKSKEIALAPELKPKEGSTSKPEIKTVADGTGGGADIKDATGSTGGGSSSAPSAGTAEVGVGAGSTVSGGDGPQGLDYAGVTVGAGSGSGSSGGGIPTFVVGGGQTQVSQNPLEAQVSPETSQVSSAGQTEAQGSAETNVAQSNVAQSGSGLHGAYIQGKTGPSALVYPFILAGANALYFWRKRRRAVNRK